MENMDKGLTVPKWLLRNRPKIPQMPKNLSAQIVCRSPKVWDFYVNRLHGKSVVREEDEGGWCALVGWCQVLQSPSIKLIMETGRWQKAALC